MTGLLVLGVVGVLVVALLWFFPLRYYTGGRLRDIHRRENWRRESARTVWAYRVCMTAVFATLFAVLVLRS